VADDGLETAAVAGRGDDRVGLHPAAVGHLGARAVERVDGGLDPDPPVLEASIIARSTIAGVCPRA
jgi:hypothetical protein